MKEAIERFIKNFVALFETEKDYTPSPLISYKAIILLILTFISSVVFLFYGYIDLQEGDKITGYLEILLAIICFLNPFLLMMVKNINFVTSLNLSLIGAIFISAAFEELPEDISSLIWINVYPVASFILKGKRGIIWSFGFLFLFSVVIVLKDIFNKGVDYSYLSDAYFSYLLILLIIYFYEEIYDRSKKSWKKLATTDKLTDCINRYAFEDTLNREVERARKYSYSLSIILFDLDNFKEINDNYGHLKGDDVLKMTADIVRSLLRKTDFLCRWGGEEFLILATYTDKRQAFRLAERIREAIESTDFGLPIKVTASFGVTDLEEDDDIDSLLARADKALYEAKKTGKNKVIVK